MIYIISGIIILGIIAALISYSNSKKRLSKNSKTGASGEEPNPVEPSDCCGQHEVCERDSLLAAVSKKIEYYDDEELDIYSGLSSDSYSKKAIEEFSEVLYTLREIEVAGWLRSLQLRGINLPDQLKDEALLIVEERRAMLSKV